MNQDESTIARRNFFRIVGFTCLSFALRLDPPSRGKIEQRCATQTEGCAFGDAERIKRISATEYGSFMSLPIPAFESPFKEIECFADDRRSIAGGISFHSLDGDWAFVVLRPDENQTFRAVAAKVCITNRDTARARLLETMKNLGPTASTGLSFET